MCLLDASNHCFILRELVRSRVTHSSRFCVHCSDYTEPLSSISYLLRILAPSTIRASATTLAQVNKERKKIKDVVERWDDG